MERLRYLELDNCYRFSNGRVELIVTTDVGPRIIRYANIGGENMLAEIPETTVETSFGTWKPLGGHRLWAAPEVLPRTYVPDNDPIDYRIDGDRSIHLIQPMEAQTGLVKEMIVTLDATGSGVTVVHRITNRGVWGVELAPWALTIVRGGGTTIIPQEPYRSHSDWLLPARPLVLWHYTDLSDPRWRLGPKYIRLRSDGALTHPQKAGVANRQGWGAYASNGELFVKRFGYEEGASYPDLGCNTETYTEGEFMEVESLGPMRHLEPGETVEHVERWYLFRDVTIGDVDDEALHAIIEPLLAGTEG